MPRKWHLAHTTELMHIRNPSEHGSMHRVSKVQDNWGPSRLVNGE